jgi:hypothetical protein
MSVLWAFLFVEEGATNEGGPTEIEKTSLLVLPFGTSKVSLCVIERLAACRSC